MLAEALLAGGAVWGCCYLPARTQHSQFHASGRAANDRRVVRMTAGTSLPRGQRGTTRFFSVCCFNGSWDPSETGTAFLVALGSDDEEVWRQDLTESASGESSVFNTVVSARRGLVACAMGKWVLGFDLVSGALLWQTGVYVSSPMVLRDGATAPLIIDNRNRQASHTSHTNALLAGRGAALLVC